jgi:hypothetical protein
VDPASLLAAIVAAAKPKLAGVAADRLVEAAKEQMRKLVGLLPDNEEKAAQIVVDSVLAESAAYPPDKALRVVPVATVGAAGIWSPHGQLRLSLLWVNHADFPIHVRDVQLAGRVEGKDDQWVGKRGDEFVLRGRSAEERLFTADAVLALPNFERGGAPVDLTVQALVSGPWNEGLAQLTHDLLGVGLWLPAVGMEPIGVLSDASDVDNMLIEYLYTQELKIDEVNVRYATLDRELGMRAGSTKERLPDAAQKKGYVVTLGRETARVTFPRGPLGPAGYPIGPDGIISGGGHDDF